MELNCFLLFFKIKQKIVFFLTFIIIIFLKNLFIKNDSKFKCLNEKKHFIFEEKEEVFNCLVILKSYRLRGISIVIFD